MARSISTPAHDPRAALADAMATEMARAADALAGRGDHEAAESLREMARHNRILALKLRVEHSLAQERRSLLAQGRTSAS
jgi:hypothetical protein